MLNRLALLALLDLTAAAAPAAAQEQIDPDAFLDRLAGRTATFAMINSGAVVGVEQFLRRDRTVWVTADGRCTYGTVDTRGPYVCFVYDDVPGVDHCWLTFSFGGALAVMSREADEVQEVTRITDEILQCEDRPLS